MLSIVRERFLKCADRHLKEANMYIEIANDRPDLSVYAVRRANQHLDMVRFWHMAFDKVHYVPGTWAYKF